MTPHATPHDSTHPRRVAVLGLGPMGAALARTLARAGHTVVTHNRSPKDLAVLDLPFVTFEADPADAARTAEVVVVCVRDHAASRDLVERIAPALAPGVPVVNLSSGTSEQAAASARAADALGVAYVTGAIMVPTPLVGTEHNLVLVAGAATARRAALPVLADLGGTIDDLGDDHALPPVLDMAMLDLFFVGMYAFLHSAALARSHGIEPTRYLPYAEGLVSTLATELPGLAQAFEDRTYQRGQANLAMCLSFLDHIVETSQAAGTDPTLPRLVRDATRRTLERHPDHLDWEVVVEDLAPLGTG